MPVASPSTLNTCPLRAAFFLAQNMVYGVMTSDSSLSLNSSQNSATLGNSVIRPANMPLSVPSHRNKIAARKPSAEHRASLKRSVPLLRSRRSVAVARIFFSSSSFPSMRLCSSGVISPDVVSVRWWIEAIFQMYLSSTVDPSRSLSFSSPSSMAPKSAWCKRSSRSSLAYRPIFPILLYVKRPSSHSRIITMKGSCLPFA
mmetsp:Transcript_9858/g.25938  ORF Transcript_9858/g.25938 Transcript_9858/m.25938 type:complete len:201 (-) Transcript_9858:406-1008(-)